MGVGVQFRLGYKAREKGDGQEPCCQRARAANMVPVNLPWPTCGGKETAMLKMFLLIYILAGPTLAGILMTAALAARLDNSTMLWLIAAGAIIAIPVAWMVAKVLVERTGWGQKGR